MSRRKKRKNEIVRGYFLNTKISFFEPLLKKYFRNYFNNRLLHQLNSKCTPIENVGQYVFFPLHYEPERTTNPDGLEFYDQFSALLALRKLVPDHINIVVKEHYSQFTGALSGYRGRSPAFYDLIKSLNGVFLVDPQISSKKLILESLATSTITGTAALEAALYKVPSLIFGNAWFNGFPGIVNYSELISFENVIEAHKIDGNKAKIWFKEKAARNGIFMTINPSNRKYFNDFYDKPELMGSELKGVKSAVLCLLDALR
jgi:hypothetical protein